MKANYADNVLSASVGDAKKLAKSKDGNHFVGVQTGRRVAAKHKKMAKLIRYWCWAKIGKAISPARKTYG